MFSIFIEECYDHLYEGRFSGEVKEFNELLDKIQEF